MKGRIRSKVLLNATVIVKGGGVQAVVSFIRSLVIKRKIDEIDWYLAISPAVNQQLMKFGIKLNSEKDIVLLNSPSKSRKARKHLLEYVNQMQINCVFTFFGPAYVKFSVPHVCGVADGWVTHSDWESYTKIPSWIARLKMFLLCIYKGVWIRRADAWFVEQDAARKGLRNRLGININKISVIANNCADHYREYTGEPLLDDGKTRILIFASYYPNKNIESVPHIIKALVDLGHDDVEFILTINNVEAGFENVLEMASSLGVIDLIRNIGPVNILDGPALYRSCKILLMPSVLETFSAVYLEAMSMGLPIVTTDKSFSRSICANAASYYQSNCPQDAAKAISKLLTDESFFTRLVTEGRKRLQFFPDVKTKYQLLHNLVYKYAR